MWQTYWQPTTLDEALRLLREHGHQARIVAGGTDVLVELQRGIRPTDTLIDISRVAGLRYARLEHGSLRLGALTTHNDVIAVDACTQAALPLAQACWEVGAPQIRTRATVAGNLVTASPANDTITPLMALDAELVLTTLDGERIVPLREFYTGVRRTVLRPDELLREIRVPALTADQRGLFLKLGLRRAQAISVVNVALVVRFDGECVVQARIALGCVAPTVVRAHEAESFLIGKRLDAASCAAAGQLAGSAIAPIDDLRGSAWYRRVTVSRLVAHGLQRIAAGEHAAGWPLRPVLLETASPRAAAPPAPGAPLSAVQTTINGRPSTLAGAHTKTLLDAMRQDAGLTGPKEGCAEGECGACTVWLDGQAVMACLVPAAQAHGATVTTIEGLGSAQLHPLQEAFIARGAVQCGFCIPGMLMAGAKLLQEHPRPDLTTAQIALSGNICRCTGYRKILEAVLDAGGAL
ncbi:FAD binding domain-containing protein [Kallotenue papyrolyticum]|uniref:FAD binding domain-containing protein n=1 Tax=Kallotenue papyrolyticum TaxID=1325125 RepID=UPI00046F4543|nr:FAD binding domain-containing protein [Kallotenue papyrolyticum]